MKTPVALLTLVFLGHVLAQATATPRATDPSLIFDLLGTVNTIEVSLPEEVRHVFVIAMHEGEVVLDADREATAKTATVAVTAGALVQVTDCPLLLFADLEFFRRDGRGHSGSRATACPPLKEAGRVRASIMSPLATFRGSLDLPLDTWLAVETFGVTTPNPTEDAGAIGSDVVFYLHLSTLAGEGLPDPPSYETCEELRNAFR